MPQPPGPVPRVDLTTTWPAGSLRPTPHLVCPMRNQRKANLIYFIIVFGGSILVANIIIFAFYFGLKSLLHWSPPHH